MILMRKEVGNADKLLDDVVGAGKDIATRGCIMQKLQEPLKGCLPYRILHLPDKQTMQALQQSLLARAP